MHGLCIGSTEFLTRTGRIVLEFCTSWIKSKKSLNHMSNIFSATKAKTHQTKRKEFVGVDMTHQMERFLKPLDFSGWLLRITVLNETLAKARWE